MASSSWIARQWAVPQGEEPEESEEESAHEVAGMKDDATYDPDMTHIWLVDISGW